MPLALITALATQQTNDPLSSDFSDWKKTMSKKSHAKGEALTQCWDALDDYGRSLACIAFGLLGAQDAAERLWSFFLQTRAS
ncbi:hypothetical protein Thiowin_01556 [Thiorhodovibrio winogradskyi]|uniref:Uncharacterized protein n=1 Tax=Thiorhodovibrio winogradskyi TaxID=77007 RepID=A0ABZ0S8I8_9GAMM